MATAQEAAVRRQVMAQLASEGYSTQITRWPSRMTWYKTVRREDGSLEEVAMPNLPADAWHMERYLRRGFRPDLPRTGPPPVADTTAVRIDIRPANQDETAYLAEAEGVSDRRRRKKE